MFVKQHSEESVSVQGQWLACELVCFWLSYAFIFTMSFSFIPHITCMLHISYQWNAKFFETSDCIVSGMFYVVETAFNVNEDVSMTNRGFSYFLKWTQLSTYESVFSYILSNIW